MVMILRMFFAVVNCQKVSDQATTGIATDDQLPVPPLIVKNNSQARSCNELTGPTLQSLTS